MMISVMDTVRQRIQQRMEQLHLSANAVSERAGVHRSVLGKFLNGTNRELRDSNLNAVADVLGCSAAYLRGDTDTLHPTPRQMASEAPATSNDVQIVGIVEAGAFRERDWFEDSDLGVIVGGFDPNYAADPQFGFKVRGDSMDLAGINDEDDIVCVDPWNAGIEVASGDLVVVERRSDGGHTLELTVKEIQIREDRFELLPRSTNSKHKPIVVPTDYDLGDDMEIRVVGIVIKIVRQFKPRLSARGFSRQGEGHASNAARTLGSRGNKNS